MGNKRGSVSVLEEVLRGFGVAIRGSAGKVNRKQRVRQGRKADRKERISCARLRIDHVYRRRSHLEHYGMCIKSKLISNDHRISCSTGHHPLRVYEESMVKIRYCHVSMDPRKKNIDPRYRFTCVRHRCS